MSFSNGSEFLAMGGYGLYVWGSLGMCAAVALAEIALLRLRRQALLREGGHDDGPEAEAGGAA
ncbi:MAG: heme exporter protein CcmD [Bdellovibrionales bacterium]|nr:heme exporter protein CcmD [Ramlibacter sp.]